MEKRFPIIDKTKTGRRLRCLMNSQGLSVIDVQKYMGFSTQQAVYNWLKEQSGMTIDDIVKKMLQSYGIPDESLDMALEKIKQTKF
jgi:antitoxin component HigA of HigAB toxin-antitoxin module